MHSEVVVVWQVVVAWGGRQSAGVCVKYEGSVHVCRAETDRKSRCVNCKGLSRQCRWQGVSLGSTGSRVGMGCVRVPFTRYIENMQCLRQGKTETEAGVQRERHVGEHSEQKKMGCAGGKASEN